MSIDPKKFGLSDSLVNAVNEALKGDQHKIDVNKNGKIDAQDFKKLRGEELKGNQHKIDKNKNGKIDAHDFKLLRKKNDTKLVAKPQYDKMRPAFKEEVEQVDEISKATLGSYVTKAAGSAATHTGAAAAYGGSSKSPDPKKMAQHQAIATKRTTGIQKAVGKLTKEEAEQTDEAMSPKQKAHSNRLKNNPGRKGSVFDPSSNFDAPNHKVDVVVSKDNKKETKNDVVQAKDKHDAMFKVQMKFHKMGYKVHDTKHKGMVKEEAIIEADDAVAKQIAAKKDAMQKQIQQKIAQKQMSAMQAKANKRLSNINASSHDDKEEMKNGGKEKIVINPPLKEAEDLPKAVVSKGHEIAKSLIKHKVKVREPYAVGMAQAKKSAGIKD
jgi:hypothetical protein